MTLCSPGKASHFVHDKVRAIGTYAFRAIANDHWHGLQSDAPTPDDSRLITPETTPPSIPTTPATPPPQVRHETKFRFMRTVLRNWKIGEARLQKRWIGREDRMSEFPRPQTMATPTQTYCSHSPLLKQRNQLGGAATTIFWTNASKVRADGMSTLDEPFSGLLVDASNGHGKRGGQHEASCFISTEVDPGDDADIVIGKAVAGILAATHRRTARAPQPLTC